FYTHHRQCHDRPTETGPNGTKLTPDAPDEKDGSIGNRAGIQCEIKLVDEAGTEVETGEIGEMILRGDANMKGYYKEEENTKEVLQDNWFFTGDMARQDEDGYYWMIDRKKDMILSGGVNVYPKEIENVLSAHQDIIEV